MRNQTILLLFLTLICSIIYACQSASEIEKAKYMSNGKDLYISNCQNCHGVNGEGLGDLIPPLTDTLFLKSNKENLACFIKNGASQEMIVNGKTYEEKMPGFSHLEPIDIAQIITFITNSFGNKQGIYTYKAVSNDLNNCKN